MKYSAERLLARVDKMLGTLYSRSEGDHPFNLRAFWDKTAAPDYKQLMSGTRKDSTKPLPPLFVHQRAKGEILVTMRLTTLCWLVENFFTEKQIEDYLERQEVTDDRT